MKDIEFYSHELQDEFIYNLFNGMEHGVFLDAACGNPIIGNNTYTLEKYFNWTGLAVDRLNADQLYDWSKKRNTKFVQIDATTNSFCDLIKDNFNSHIDYLSLDMDECSIDALKQILNSGVKIKSLTFEHEYHRMDDAQRTDSRKLLESIGLIRLFEDVRFPNVLGLDYSSVNLFEDWWIDPSFFPTEILTLKSSQEFYKTIVEKLRDFTKLEYKAKHMCCQSYPKEYCLYWNDNEKNTYEEKFKRYYNL